MPLLHDYLIRSASATAEATAIVDPVRERQVTYGQLDELSTSFALSLKEEGVRAGDRVGIFAPKSISVVAAIFGTLKAGGGYVPVDVHAPVERAAYIFSDCEVGAIFVDREHARPLIDALGSAYQPSDDLPSHFDATGADLVLIKRRAPSASLKVDNLSYILYTSGSTGKPKGVTHTHASASSFVDWCSQVLQPTEGDRFSSHAPFHFDLSILDLYVPIKHGASIILIGEELGKQPAVLAEVIAQRRITIWYSTPSILRLLVEYGELDQRDYSALRIVNYAGEVFPAKHLRTLTEIWPHPRYFNLYGPTETNVCTYDEIPVPLPGSWEPPYSIGVTCSNDRSIIMDDELRPVPDGDAGELLISGGSVMHGYWNLPQRSSDAFWTDERGTRWYRTGDVVKRGDDGDLLFLGRKDRMVKRRGYRIELGEIEAALYQHPEVREACVIAVPDEENGVLIRAFLSWNDGQKGSQIKLRQFAASHLPLYMIPDRFIFVAALPKTSTDKIDLQKLREMT